MAVVSSRLVFLSAICILIVPANIVRSKQEDYNYNCSANQGNYGSGSTYEANLDSVLFPHSSNKIDYGFYKMPSKDSPDKVYAIGLCRGDLIPVECRKCLNISKVNLTQQCPEQKEAIVWYEKCMLRYSSRNIFSTMDDTPEYPWMSNWSVTNYSNDEQAEFSKDLRNFLKNLSGQAAAGDSLFKYAVGKASAPRSQELFGLMQCTPDLSKENCSQCLSGAIDKYFWMNYSLRIGGRILRPSCNFRYETYKFYDSTVYPLPGNKSQTWIIVVVVSVVALVVLAISIYIYLRVWKRWREKTASKFRWDVFLSFRGEDTRKNFIDHLYPSLVQKGIRVFQDEEKLQRGETISTGLLNGIKESRIFIVVFSKNFASSRWCLDELVEIMGHKETIGRTLLPIFYHIKPSDVRSQTGIFAEAFAMHEEQFPNNIDKVDKWKKALAIAANCSGLDLESIANGHEARFIKKIVDEVLKILKVSDVVLRVRG